MSITSVTQYSDGLGECSALSAMQSLGVTTGRTSNDAYASAVSFQTVAERSLSIGALQVVDTFFPTARSNFSWIYVQIRIESLGPLVAGEFLDVRASFMDYELRYPIYPGAGVAPNNYQCGPFLRTFRFGPVSSVAPIATVSIGVSSAITRRMTVKTVFIQTL